MLLRQNKRLLEQNELLLRQIKLILEQNALIKCRFRPAMHPPATKTPEIVSFQDNRPRRGVSCGERVSRVLVALRKESGRRARTIVGQISWLRGFRRDAENGNRDGCAPRRRVMDDPVLATFQVARNFPRRIRGCRSAQPPATFWQPFGLPGMFYEAAGYDETATNQTNAAQNEREAGIRY